jgi:hypothetical protein
MQQKEISPERSPAGTWLRQKGEARMQEKEFREYLRSRKQTEESIEAAVGFADDLQAYLDRSGKALESVSVGDVRAYMSVLIEQKKNTMERLVALARYAYMAGMNEVYIYFTKILGGREVLPSIAKRLASLTDQATRDRIFEGVEAPPLGSPPETYPEVTRELVERLLDLGPETCHRVLAGNHHGIPVESFDKHKEWYREAGSIEGFLRKVHEEAVRELEQYYKEGKVWYEQEITPEIIEFVRGNQEILSAVRDGDYLYNTKFPYSPKDWLAEADPLKKRYYACHCPLAREAIFAGRPEIPLDWCYCSGGYQKLKFDVVFGEPTEIEVLESVLSGDDRCRFRVKIPEGLR